MLVQDRITTKALRLLVVFVSIVAVAAIGISLRKLGGSLTLSYLPNGIAVAATYRFGRRVWPAVFLAGMSIVLWTHEPLPASIGVGIGLASGAFMGGGPLYVWGTLLMGLVGFCVAISLGELASAMPHSGGQYFWVAQLAPPRIRRPLSYLTGIFSWGGAVFTGASGSITIPLMILGMASLRNPEFEYKTWMGFVGFQITTWAIFCLNLFERLLPYLGKVALILPVITFIIMFISILAVSEKQSAEFVFTEIRNASGWNDGIAWMIGISAIHWCFSCLDSCTHMADEIPNPTKNIPKVLLWTVGLGLLTGFPFAIAIWYAVNDVDALVASFVPPSLQVFYQALGGNTNGALGI